MRLIYAFLLISISTIVPFGVNAQTRHALVIGIDDYDYVEPLQKARNDARAVHGALEAAGFEADLLLDGTGISVVQALEAFTDRLSPGDEAVFFFAGHGVELEGENILLPADIPAPERGGDLLVRRFGIPVQDVLDQIQRRGARLSLLILDACRDNPFPRQGTRSLGGTRGLAEMRAPEGAYIMYSAGAGQAALDRLSDDDPDPNSVFTRALLPRLTTPGLRLRDMVLEVRSEVRQLAMSVEHNQFPAVYDQLDGEFQFIEGEAPKRDRPSPPTPPRAEITYDIIAGGEPCPSDGCFRGDVSMDLVATVDGVRYRVARYSHEDNVHALWIIDVQDLDNDGYADIVYRTFAGGNAVPAFTHVASYRGDGRFSVNALDDFNWDEPSVVRDGNEWRIRTQTVAAGVGNSTLHDEIMEFKLQDGVPVQVAAATRSALFSQHSFSADDVERGRDNHSWGYDFTGDGEDETLACGYWERWGLLTHCAVEYVARGALQAMPLVKAQCKEIGVLDQRVNGFNQLVCDFDQVYQVEPDFHAYLPVTASRYKVQPDLSLNVRAGPDADRNLVTTLDPSTPVMVLDRSGDWVRIVAAGVYVTTQDGWVNSRFLIEQ